METDEWTSGAGDEAMRRTVARLFGPLIEAMQRAGMSRKETREAIEKIVRHVPRRVLVSAACETLDQGDTTIDGQSG